jgi:hypothetical protein
MRLPCVRRSRTPGGSSPCGRRWRSAGTPLLGQLPRSVIAHMRTVQRLRNMRRSRLDNVIQRWSSRIRRSAIRIRMLSLSAAGASTTTGRLRNSCGTRAHAPASRQRVVLVTADVASAVPDPPRARRRDRRNPGPYGRPECARTSAPARDPRCNDKRACQCATRIPVEACRRARSGSASVTPGPPLTEPHAP